MGKGKKKKANKGKKKDGKKTEDDAGVGGSSWLPPTQEQRSGGKNEKVRDDETSEGDSPTFQLRLGPEQVQRARLAAANRTEDPLKNWTRLQNEDCPICMLPCLMEQIVSCIV